MTAKLMHKTKPVEIRRHLEHFTIGKIKISDNLLVLLSLASFSLTKKVTKLKKKAESFIDKLARKGNILHFGICDSKPIDAFNYEVEKKHADRPSRTIARRHTDRRHHADLQQQHQY